MAYLYELPCTSRGKISGFFDDDLRKQAAAVARAPRPAPAPHLGVRAPRRGGAGGAGPRDRSSLFPQIVVEET
ncbi:MAG: hypothetical protein PVSMB6_12060 [Steroidobacteraceae bacterium]